MVQRGLCLGSAEVQVQVQVHRYRVQRCRGAGVQGCKGAGAAAGVARVVQRWCRGDAVVLYRWFSKNSAEVVCRGAELLIRSIIRTIIIIIILNLPALLNQL